MPESILQFLLTLEFAVPFILLYQIPNCRGIIISTKDLPTWHFCLDLGKMTGKIKMVQCQLNKEGMRRDFNLLVQAQQLNNV
jgi:hypothetical protein